VTLMRRRLLGLFMAVVFASSSALVNTGCGTVMGHAGPQKINVHVNPDVPADVTLDGMQKVGAGSGTYEVDPKRESHNFTAATTDGRKGSQTVTRELMPMVVVADAFMLLFPILIDYFNGGMYKWPTDVGVNMGSQPAPTPPPPDPTPSNITPPAPEMVKCATCGELRPANSETCPHCGMK
jgi:hypothetical protein